MKFFAKVSASILLAISCTPAHAGVLGKFQQKTLAHAFGGAAAMAVGLSSASPVAGAAAGYVVGNHAEKKWTGNGLKNWRRPHRW